MPPVFLLAAAVMSLGLVVAAYHDVVAEPPRDEPVKVTICLAPADYKLVEAALKKAKPGDGKVCSKDHRQVQLDRETAILLLTKLVGGIHGNPPIPEDRLHPDATIPRHRGRRLR